MGIRLVIAAGLAASFLAVASAEQTESSSIELIPMGAEWRYLDDRSDQGTAWYATGFDDSSWLTGQGQLGFGGNGETTLIHPGTTTYFRRSFEVSDANSITNLTLSVIRDDGVVVYVNGTNVFQNNINSPVTYTTFAITNISGQYESIPVERSIPTGVITNGINTIAAEMHLYSSFPFGDSDMSFDLSMTALLADTVSLVVTSDYGVVVPSAGTNEYSPGAAVACYVTESPLILNGSTQVICSGWTGTGSVTNGSGTNTTVILTNDSSITWHWATNAFFLETESTAGGFVAGTEGWFPPGSTSVLSAVSSENYRFSEWTGDTEGIDETNATVSIIMDKAKDLTAHFEFVTSEGALPVPFVDFAAESVVDRLFAANQVSPLGGPASSDFVGCAAVPASNIVLVLVNDPPSIQVYDMEGAYTGQYISLTGFSDPEGICVVDRDTGLFAIVEEATNDISIVTITASTSNLVKSAAEIVSMELDLLSGYDAGIQGVAYHAGADGFFAVKEKQPMAIYWVPRQPGTTAPASLELFDAEASLGSICSDLSDIAYDQYSDRLFLLSSETPLIVECDMEGLVKDTFSLSQSSPEGISVSDVSFSILTVTHDGGYAEHQATAPSGSGNEGTQAEIEVRLSWPWTNVVSVDYEITSEDADGGSDYSPTNGTLTFIAGTTNASITIDIHSDIETEDAELLAVSLTNAVNSRTGRESSFEYVIAANTAQQYVVISAHGGTVPSRGTNYAAWGDEVYFAVTNSPVINESGTTQYVCTGWTGTGSISGGNGTETTQLITEDSSITWLWQTNLWLSVGSTAGGEALGGNEWIALGSSARVDAVTFEDRHFAGWTGDVPAASTNERPLWLSMDLSRSVQAVFDVNTTTNGTLTYPVVSFSSTSLVDRLELLQSMDLYGAFISDISACCLGPGTNEMMAVSDDEVIHVYDVAGTYKRSITLYGFDDTEGMCQYDPAQDLYAIVEERIAEITIVEITESTPHLLKSEGTTISLGLGNLGNAGIEGIFYDTTNNCFYAVKEYNDMKVYRVTIDGTSATTEELFDAEEVFAGIAANPDLSDIAYNPKSGLLYILSEQGKRLFECDLSGNILASLPVPSAYQPEGITLSADMSEVYIVGETNEYFRYELAPLSDSGPEGSSLEMTVELSWAWTNTISVDYEISSDDPEVTPGIDFSPITGTVVFAPGTTTQVITVSIPVDEETEADETINAVLTNEVNARLSGDRFYDYTILENTAVSLIVRSAKNGCTPPPGTNIFNAGTTVPCLLTNSPIETGTMATQYLCVGWSGTNDVPAAGAGTNAGSVLLTTDSTITWLWNTNVYLDVSWAGSGTVDTASGWYQANSNIQVMAEPDTYHHFVSWTGDVEPADTNDPQITLEMDSPTEIAAEFAANLATNSTPEWWLARHHGHTNDFDALALSDLDKDGMQAWEENIADTIPNNPTSRLALTDLRMEYTNAVIEWLSVTTRQYSVYRSLDLINDWDSTPIASNLQGQLTGTNVFTDTNAFDGASYQIRTTRP